MRYLKPIPKCLTEKQTQSLGAVIFWLELKDQNRTDHTFNKWLAITCIKLQGYFDPKVVG